MALKADIPSMGGAGDYLRIRSFVYFRDQPGEVSGFKNIDNQPDARLQIDFEAYSSEAARKEGRAPIGGVHSFLINVEEGDLFDSTLAKKLYCYAKQHEVLRDSEDI